MSDDTGTPAAGYHSAFVQTLAWLALAGCVVFAVSILVADFVVPDHDWIADTISDLGAGKYEYIVDIGIYCFSTSLIAVALLCAHVHLDGWRWSAGTLGFAALALIVFLIGARNEYGDADRDGAVIHIYLVYALGLLMVLIPLLMARGAGRINRFYARVLMVIAALWVVSAPVFFFLPTGIDGIYERYLGLLAFALIGAMAGLFLKHRRSQQ